jgi:ribose transport system permease protein
MPKNIQNLLLRYTTLIMFVLLVLIFAILAPRFFQLENILNIIKQASFVGIVAVGMIFVLLTAGIDLSVGAVMYLAPLIAGFAMRSWGIGVFPALLICLLAGLIMGAINAFFIVRLTIIPFIVTLSSLFAFRGAGTFLTQSTQLDFPQRMLDFGQTRFLGIAMPIIVFVIVVVTAYVILKQTPFGRQIYAIGNDPEVARKAGLPVKRTLASVYMISSLCAALGGFILISQIGRLDQSFGEGREFDVIAAAVLGGTSLFGGVGGALSAVIGAVFIQTVNNGLIFANINLYLQPIVQAGIIFLAVFFDSLRATNLQKLKRRLIRAKVQDGKSTGQVKAQHE